ncbi:MAG TPA: glycosyltransferase family 4 protein [Terriglobales bacterium]|nr:glycosyltransferase family 4 protein [Terriglobales bacterium]
MNSEHELANILFVHGNNDLYGGDIALLELIKRLDRKRFRPLVVLPNDTRHINRLSAKLEREGVACRFVRMAVIRRKYLTASGLIMLAVNFVAGVVALMYLIWRNQVALVHSNTVAVLCGAFSAQLMRRPHVWHIHEIITRPAIARKILHPVVTRRSTVVAVVSQAVRRHILEDCPSQGRKIRVIYHGIDVPAFADGNGNLVRREFGIPLGAFLVGMVGKVCRWKGQLLLVEAARIVSKQREGVCFLAVGGVFDDEMHFMASFRNAVSSNYLSQNFIIGDYRSDIRDVVSALDVFVLPSTEPDPCPAVVLEAMAAGKAVIAARHGGPVEQVIEGETGLLFTPGSADSLAAAIIALVDDPDRARAMGSAGRKRASAHFCVERYAHDFDSLYRELISGSYRPVVDLDDELTSCSIDRSQRLQ